MKFSFAVLAATVLAATAPFVTLKLNAETFEPTCPTFGDVHRPVEGSAAEVAIHEAFFEYPYTKTVDVKVLDSVKSGSDTIENFKVTIDINTPKLTEEKLQMVRANAILNVVGNLNLNYLRNWRAEVTINTGDKYPTEVFTSNSEASIQALYLATAQASGKCKRFPVNLF